MYEPRLGNLISVLEMVWFVPLTAAPLFTYTASCWACHHGNKFYLRSAELATVQTLSDPTPHQQCIVNNQYEFCILLLLGRASGDLFFFFLKKPSPPNQKCCVVCVWVYVFFLNISAQPITPYPHPPIHLNAFWIFKPWIVLSFLFWVRVCESQWDADDLIYCDISWAFWGYRADGPHSVQSLRQ